MWKAKEWIWIFAESFYLYIYFLKTERCRRYVHIINVCGKEQSTDGLPVTARVSLFKKLNWK